MDCIAQKNDNTNVVIKVYWRCSAEQVENDVGYSTFVERNTEIAYNHNNSFVPYDQLTESTVLEWVHTKVSYTTKEKVDVTVKEATESELQNNLNIQISPVIIEMNLPW